MNCKAEDKIAEKGGFAVRCPNCGNDIPVAAKAGEVQQDKVYSVMQWFGSMLLMLVPGVNIVLLLVWAFSNNVGKNKKNWAIASLLMFVVITVLLIIICYAAYSMFISMFDSMFSE